MAAIMTGRMVGAIVIAEMAVHHLDLKELLADRFIFRTAHQLAQRAPLQFGQAKLDMAGISIGMATGSVANNSMTKILNGMTEKLDSPDSPLLNLR